ncbi:MAG: serine hydrolase domain-containing protein [Bacteroidota bacterium]
MYQKTITLLLFLLMTGLIKAQDYDQLSKTVDKFFTKYIADNKPGAAVVVVKDGKVVHKNAYGVADYEHQVPMSTESVFDIASVSKQFAGYAIALLEQEGKLTLQDDVRTYIPEFPDFEYTITVGHLLFHQSGLRDWPSTMKLAGVGYEDVLTFDQILAMAYRQEGLNFVPGTKHIYSNTNYNLLVEVVQRISGQSFREWTKERIFQPLGMKNTFFRDRLDESIPNAVKSYFKESDKKYRETNDLKLSTNNLAAMGSSSLQTTIDDFALWLQHLDSKEAKDLMAKMQIPGKLPATERAFYAYGLEVDTYGGLQQIYHDGGWASFNTFMAYFPEQHFSVAVFMNHANWVEGFANAVTDLYLEDAFQEEEDELDFYDEETPEIPKNLKLDYSLYTWVYYLERYLVYLTITEENGKLYVQATGENKQLMEAVSANRFWVDAFDTSIYFNMNRAGKPESVTYHKSLCPRREPMPAKTALDLSAYEGHYYSRELNAIYQVALKNGQLSLSSLRNGEIPLEQACKEGFITDTGYAPLIEFQRNPKGEIVSFSVSQYRSRNQVFRKQDIRN